MNIQKNKSKTTAIAFVLLCTFVVTMVSVPITTAAEVPRYSYIALQRYTLGVGQTTVIQVWSNAVPPTARGAAGDRWDFYVDITKDGSTTTIGPIVSDPVGGAWTTFTPAEVGEYSIVSRLEDQTLTGLPPQPDGTIYSPQSVGDVYLAAVSEPVILTVEEDPIEGWPEAPFPPEVWYTRPVTGLNRDWSKLLGNWFGTSCQRNGPTNTLAGVQVQRVLTLCGQLRCGPVVSWTLGWVLTPTKQDTMKVLVSSHQ